VTTLTNAAHNRQTRKFSLLGLARRMDAAYRQRQTLRKLDDAALKDIGLTREQAAIEASRRLWDVPSFWLR